MTELRKKMLQQMQLKGYSENTIETYLDCLSTLSKHFNLSPDLLSKEQIRDFFQWQMVERKRSKSMLNQYISALKILYREVLKIDWDQYAIPRPRCEKRLPVVLSKEEVERLISLTRNIKHRALLMVKYSSGLRMSEVINLKITDIDSSRMQLRIVQAKGFKDRYTVLSSVTLEYLRNYYKSFRPKIFLFETKPGKSMSEKAIQSAFKKAMARAGIHKKTGIHSLRHSFATHLMEQGVSLPIIQQLLGHKSLRTTSVYLHVQQYSLEKVKSPIDSLSV